MSWLEPTRLAFKDTPFFGDTTKKTVTKKAVATKDPTIPDEQAKAGKPAEEAPTGPAKPSPEPEPMQMGTSAPNAIPEPKKPKRGGWWQKITR